MALISPYAPPRALPIRMSPEVQDALNSRQPVIALESNVISHGLPRPLNLKTAIEVEDAIRQRGVVPATIAVLDGTIAVGLSDGELDRIANSGGVKKASSRNLASCLASELTAATTIATTMAIAHVAGIKLVASAGLGGVHRDVGESMDVSADLIQLTRSKVMLVCAGAKSILDLPKTLEYLETQSVPVIGFRCEDFPAFYLTSSGLKSPDRIDDPATLALAAEFHWTIPGSAGLAVAHPIAPADALDPGTVEAAICDALSHAEALGIKGPAITKFLMQAVDVSTGGASSAANVAVLKSTAVAAAEIAVAWPQDTKVAE